jgi:hypothetical protein
MEYFHFHKFPSLVSRAVMLDIYGPRAVVWTRVCVTLEPYGLIKVQFFLDLFLSSYSFIHVSYEFIKKYYCSLVDIPQKHSTRFIFITSAT